MNEQIPDAGSSLPRSAGTTMLRDTAALLPSSGMDRRAGRAADSRRGLRVQRAQPKVYQGSMIVQTDDTGYGKYVGGNLVVNPNSGLALMSMWQRPRSRPRPPASCIRPMARWGVFVR